MTYNITCLRCGTCCHYYIDGKFKKCKHLVKLNDGKTLCRIYNGRLGTVLDKDSEGNFIRCIMRKDSPFDYPGCPYNTDKPVRR